MKPLAGALISRCSPRHGLGFLGINLWRNGWVETWVRYVHLCPMWRKQRGIRKAQYRYIRDICPSVAVCMYIFRNMFFHSRVYVWHLLYFALPFQRRLALWTQMRWQCLCKVHRISSKKKGWKPLACSMIMAHGFATNTTAPFLFSQYCMENNNCRVCGAFVTKASIS